MIEKKHEQNKKHVGENSRGWQKQMSWILSGSVLLSFFVFMTGYFFGQQRALYLFTQKVEQESLSDQIYSSLCVLYDTDDESESQANLLPQASDEMALDTDDKDYEQQTHVVEQQVVQPSAQPVSGTTYYAQLIGFGTYKAAERFVARLAQRDIKAIVKKRQSRTASGKMRYWYQVVTDVYTDKRELELVVNAIQVSEKIKDIRIITC